MGQTKRGHLKYPKLFDKAPNIFQTEQHLSGSKTLLDSDFKQWRDKKMCKYPIKGVCNTSKGKILMCYRLLGWKHCGIHPDAS